jgi:hypothetical protein
MGRMGNEYFTLSPNEAQVGEAVRIYLAVVGIVHGARISIIVWDVLTQDTRLL